MIFVTSYPYIGERHRRVFDFFKKKDDLVLILPEIWKMKDGKVVMKTKPMGGIKTMPIKTYFFHSKYPIIRGHLKGWMPAQKSILKKMAKPGDILYSVSEPNLLVTYLNGQLAKKLKMKHVVFTWQNIPYAVRLSGLKLKITEWLVRKNLSLSKGVICGNENALEVLKPYMPAGFKHLVSPVSGLDIDKFKPGINSDFRKRYNLENKIVILFVGAIDERKGIFKLVDAFNSARKQELKLHLFIIGSGSLDDELGNYVKENNLNSYITIIPWVNNSDLPEFFSNSDVFAYPSQKQGGWEEQFGFSIAEASSSGLPVISTHTGSIKDLVIDGKTGILVDPENINMLTKALLKLAGDKDLRNQMGNAGREFIKNNFSHQIVAEKLELFLRNV